MLTNCTAKFNVLTDKWIKVNDHDLGPGGELILGAETEAEKRRLYYLGGIDSKSGNKSKAIYEYEAEFGWRKWSRILPVPHEMGNSWGVMKMGNEFCPEIQKNMTRALGGFQAWKFKDSSRLRYYNAFENDNN